MKLNKLTLTLLISISSIYAQTDNSTIDELIATGKFNTAKLKIQEILHSGNNSNEMEERLKFEIERMNRIELDFTKSGQFELDYIHKYIPSATESDLEKWGEDGSLELKVINREIKYFNRAHTNFFRINKKAKAIKEKIEGKEIQISRIEGMKQIDRIIPSSENHVITLPTKMSIDYTITVNADAVPEGKIIKCWMPFPRDDINRQENIVIQFVNSDKYLISSNDYYHKSLYLEKHAVKGKPTVFNYRLTMVSSAEYFNLANTRFITYDTSNANFIKFTSEREPHIIFSEKIKTLSKSIIGDETNPYKKSKLIFTWISKNIPWAGAREYSTLRNIPEYCLTTGHGDCGIKTLLFITLCRFNGIPARWQSGWMLHPGAVNLHDWAEIYFEGVGWVPVDQSFGIQKFDDETKKYFYLGGIDSYRMIVNSDYSAIFSPPKKNVRSETVDFQRGEVEWEGGNLYFDKWDYHMEVNYLSD